MNDNIQIRDTRELFAWQSRSALRILYENFEGSDSKNLVCLYVALTLKASQTFANELTTTIGSLIEYSHVTRDYVPKGMQKLQDAGLIDMVDIRGENGQFSGKLITLKAAPVQPFVNGGFLNADPSGTPIEAPIRSVAVKDKSMAPKDNIVSTRPPRKKTLKKYPVDRELWDSVKDIIIYATENNNMVMQMPEDDESDAPVYVSKKLLTTIQLIYQIKEDEFLSSYKQSSKSLKGEDYREQLKKALDAYKVMQTDYTVWPYDKTKMTKSLDTWIYNPTSGFSYFLKCLDEAPKSTGEVLMSRHVSEDVTDEILDIFIKWWDIYHFAINDLQVMSLKVKVTNLLKEHKKIWEEYGQYYDKLGNWRPYFGGEEPLLFCKRFSEFLNEQCGEPNVGKVSPTSMSFANFKTWVSNEYKFNLDMTEEQRAGLVARVENKKAIVESTHVTQEDVMDMLDITTQMTKV